MAGVETIVHMVGVETIVHMIGVETPETANQVWVHVLLAVWRGREYQEGVLVPRGHGLALRR